MRILIYSDHFSHTSGYARTIRDILPYLKKGNEVRQVSLGYNSYPLSDDIVCYPTKLKEVEDYWGSEILFYAMKDFKPDIVFSLQDFFIMRKIAFNMAHPGPWKWVHWGTLDGTPVDYSCREALKWVDHVICHAKFAEDEIKKIVPDVNINTIYPPVDPKIFHELDKEKLREKFKLKGKKVILNCGRNQMRKNVPLLLDSMMELRKQIPEIVLILASTCETKTDDNMKGGYEFDYFIKDRKLEDCIIVPNIDSEEPVSDEILNEQYNLADVQVHPAVGEGYGLIFAEAGISKVPTIGVDHSAVSEIVGNGRGILIPSRAYIYVQNGIRHNLCRPDDITKAVKEFYEKPDEAKEMGEKAHEFAKELTPEKQANLILETFQNVLDKDMKGIAKR